MECNGLSSINKAKLVIEYNKNYRQRLRIRYRYMAMAILNRKFLLLFILLYLCADNCIRSNNIRIVQW